MQIAQALQVGCTQLASDVVLKLDTELLHAHMCMLHDDCILLRKRGVYVAQCDIHGRLVRCC